jgi:hypothetical protein
MSNPKAKKVHRSFDEQFPAVSLYRQDLDELVGILKRTCKEVTIQSGDYEFESLDELQKELGNRPASLSMNGALPYIILTLTRSQPPCLRGGESGPDHCHRFG